jgi:serine/threonine-protein kinase
MTFADIVKFLPNVLRWRLGDTHFSMENKMPEEQWKTKWRQVRELGQGGQGTTYEVTSLAAPEQRGVMKLLKHENNQQARARIAHEAINLGSLAKQGVKVPGLLDHNTQHYNDLNIQLYIVMEFVPGNTLNREVEARGGRLPLEQALALTRDLCATISSMHARDVLHRDLKPANLMVRDFDKVDLVVLDLGLSFDRERKQETQTRTGETIKNELIALPEANTPSGDRRDKRSDITNIVCVFFYCLTGHLPVLLRDQRNLAPHEREGLAMRQVMAGDDRQDQVASLLDTGFAVDVDMRFQTIKELDDRLSLVLTASGTMTKDPLQLDAELGVLMRKRNRRFRLNEFVPAAQAIQQHMMAYVQTLSQTKTFLVNLGGVTYNIPLPAGIDPVYEIPVAIQVGIRNFSVRRQIKLTVGAKGDNCVLLCAVGEADSQGRFVLPKSWEELGWFNPEDSPNVERVLDWIKRKVASAMDAVVKEEAKS